VGVEAREASAKRRDDETSGVAGRGERGVEKDAGCREKKKSSETAGDGEPGMRAASKPRPPTHLDARARITLAARRRGRRETRIRRT